MVVRISNSQMLDTNIPLLGVVATRRTDYCLIKIEFFREEKTPS